MLATVPMRVLASSRAPRKSACTPTSCVTGVSATRVLSRASSGTAAGSARGASSPAHAAPLARPLGSTDGRPLAPPPPPPLALALHLLALPRVAGGGPFSAGHE